MPKYLRLSPAPCFRRCFADHCETTVARDQLMCREHWRQVPPAIQLQVIRAMQAFRVRGELTAYATSSIRAQLAVAAARRKAGQ